MTWHLPTRCTGEVEFILTERLRQITYMVTYTVCPIIPASWSGPEEGGIELDGCDVVAIEFLDSDGGQLGGYSLAAKTLTDAEAKMIESHYDAEFGRASDEILSRIAKDLESCDEQP